MKILFQTRRLFFSSKNSSLNLASGSHKNCFRMKKTWMKAKHLLKCEFFVYVFCASEQRLILSSAYSTSAKHTHSKTFATKFVRESILDLNRLAWSWGCYCIKIESQCGENIFFMFKSVSVRCGLDQQRISQQPLKTKHRRRAKVKVHSFIIYTVIRSSSFAAEHGQWRTQWNTMFERNIFQKI